MNETEHSSGKSNGSANGADNYTSNSTSELTEVIRIEDTPFSAVRIENKYFLAMGKYRLTDLVDTYQEIEQNVHNITWNRLTQVIAIICDEEISKAKNSQKLITEEFNNQKES